MKTDGACLLCVAGSWVNDQLIKASLGTLIPRENQLAQLGNHDFGGRKYRRPCRNMPTENASLRIRN